MPISHERQPDDQILSFLGKVTYLNHRLYRLCNRDWKRLFNLLALGVSPVRVHLQSFLALKPW